MAKKDKGVEVTDKVSYKQYIRQLDVAKCEFEVAQQQREHELGEIAHNLTLAHEGYNGVFRLYGDVDGSSVERLRLSTARYAATHPKAPIGLIISSPGGSMFDGFVLYDHLRALSNSGHKITTTVRGIAASMGAVLAQAGDVRVIGPESYLLIHEASSMTWGTSTAMKEEVAQVARFCRQMEQLFARRSTMSAAAIRAKTKKTDWLLDSKEARKLGFADKIG